MNFIEMLILFDRTSAYDAFTELRVSFISYVATTGYTGIQLFGCVYFNIATTGYATFRFPKAHSKALIFPPPATLRSPLSASPLRRMEPLPATLQSRLSTFSLVALMSPDPATLKLILRASSCLSKFIVLLPAILISSLSPLRGLLATNSPPPIAFISFSSRELVFISHTVGWRLSRMIFRSRLSFRLWVV